MPLNSPRGNAPVIKCFAKGKNWRLCSSRFDVESMNVQSLMTAVEFESNCGSTMNTNKVKFERTLWNVSKIFKKSNVQKRKNKQLDKHK